MVSYINHRGFEIAAIIQAGSPDPPVGPMETAFNQGSLHPRALKHGSRHPVEAGAEARGVDTPHRGGGAALAEIWQSRSRSVRLIREHSLSSVVLPNSSSSSRTGRHGTGVAEAAPVRISPDCSASGSSRESAFWTA